MTESSGASAAQPPMDAAPDPVVPGPADKKRKLYARISTVSSIVLMAVALIRLGSCLLAGPQLAACDDSSLLAQFKAALETAAQAKITSMTNIRTLSHSDRTATCQMHVTASVGPPADVTYRLDLDKDGTRFQVVPAQ